MKKNSLLVKFEILWWIFTFILLVGILYPILPYWNSYSFLITNIIYIIVFITITRYVFLLRYTFLAHKQVLKLVFIFLSVPFVFYLIQALNNFQTSLDNYGIAAMLGTASDATTTESIGSYIYSEMLLFGVGSIVSAIIFPFRLALSIWRIRNRGNV